MRDRLIYAAATLAAVLAAAGGFYLWGQRDAEARLKPAVKAAETQTRTEQATTAAVDTYATRTVIIREKADHAIRTVQAAPGADTPLAPERRALLCAALAGVRDGPVCEAGDPDRAEPAAATLRWRDDADADPG